MPFVDGMSLRQRLVREGELPIPEAVRHLRELADALAHAHRRGVVHRDIKPQNMLLSEWHALVTDFGVAKAESEATGRQSLTTAGMALGWTQAVSTAALERLAKALADRYRIERELGQGGMATVYLARDLKHDPQVALKVLKPELAAVLGAERFVVEIKATASLQHPHLLPLFDSGTAEGFLYTAEGFLYFVMPCIEGETLRQKATPSGPGQGP
jgi:serine/threonine protein kinase